jgi:hypothetical protein
VHTTDSSSPYTVCERPLTAGAAAGDPEQCSVVHRGAPERWERQLRVTYPDTRADQTRLATLRISGWTAAWRAETSPLQSQNVHEDGPDLTSDGLCTSLVHCIDIAFRAARGRFLARIVVMVSLTDCRFTAWRCCRPGSTDLSLRKVNSYGRFGWSSRDPPRTIVSWPQGNRGLQFAIFSSGSTMKRGYTPLLPNEMAP